MPRTKKRARPIPEHFAEGISKVTNGAKKQALDSLCGILNNYGLNAEDLDTLVAEVSGALDFDPATVSVPIKTPKRTPRVVQLSVRTRANSSPRGTIQSFPDDEHNEVCEVCETGGDLLCCDTCSLVYHIGCHRPQIKSIPKGKWSCAYCVADGVTSGDVDSAKKAVRDMRRMSKESMGSADDPNLNPNRRMSSESDKSAEENEVTISKIGKRFVVKRGPKNQEVEHSRHVTLESAMTTVLDLSEGTSEKERDVVWCTYCMDDKTIRYCAFCGCQKCFGKHDSTYLLLCDGCDREFHTYCLNPQKTSIPAAEEWYCKKCVVEGVGENPTEAEPEPVADAGMHADGEKELPTTAKSRRARKSDDASKIARAGIPRSSEGGVARADGELAINPEKTLTDGRRSGRRKSEHTLNGEAPQFLIKSEARIPGMPPVPVELPRREQRKTVIAKIEMANQFKAAQAAQAATRAASPPLVKNKVGRPRSVSLPAPATASIGSAHTSASSSDAGTTGSDGFPPVPQPRGRGRPLGSGKVKRDRDTVMYGGKSRTGMTPTAAGGAAHAGSKLIRNVDVMTLANALQIVQNPEVRPFYEEEKKYLAAFRRWASLGSVKEVFAALKKRQETFQGIVGGVAAPSALEPETATRVDPVCSSERNSEMAEATDVKEEMGADADAMAMEVE